MEFSDLQIVQKQHEGYEHQNTRKTAPNSWYSYVVTNAGHYYALII